MRKIKLFAFLFVLALNLQVKGFISLEPIQLPTPEKLVNKWYGKHVSNLNEDELILLANLIYCQYAYMSLDSYLRHCSQCLNNAASALRTDITTASQEHPTYKQFKKLLIAIDPLLEQHHRRFSAWFEVNEITNQPGYENVSLTVDSLGNVIQSILQQNLWQLGANLDEALAQAQQFSADAAQSLLIASQTYKRLLNGDQPAASANQNPRMAQLEAACSIIDAVQEHLQNCGQANLKVIEHAELLEETGLHIFAHCYAMVYNTLINQEISPVMMFDEQGYIPEYQRIGILPTPQQLVRAELLL